MQQAKYLPCDRTSVISKKSPNVYKSCPKMISLEKLKILTPLQLLPKNVQDLRKLIGAQRLGKVAQSPINHPIWSHWTGPSKTIPGLHPSRICLLFMILPS